MHEYGHEECNHQEHAENCDHNCAHCGQGGDPKQELKALMEYMVKHNKTHCAELAAVANQFDKLGNKLAYEQLMLAVSDFEKGNLRIATILAAISD